jgi:hypothetical protein
MGYLPDAAQCPPSHPNGWPRLRTLVSEANARRAGQTDDEQAIMTMAGDQRVFSVSGEEQEASFSVLNPNSLLPTKLHSAAVPYCFDI